MPPTVVPLASDQWENGGETLARAFSEDAQFRALFPESSSRPAVLLPFFQMALRSALLGDQVVDATESQTAVAVWSPPGLTGTPSLLTMIRTAPQALRWLRATTPGQARRAMGWGARCGSRHRALMPEPHWWLEILGVEPERQGFGLGALLLRHGLARADADRLPAYVQTEDPGNASFYTRFGFEVLEQVAPTDEPLGIAVWRMRRPPSAAPGPDGN